MLPNLIRLLFISIGLAFFQMTFALDESPATSAPTDQADGWPLVAAKNDWEVRIYHPRAESLTGDKLTARAVFSVKHFDQSGNSSGEPSFGVIWISAHADTDRESRTITLSQQSVTKLLLANANDQDKSQLSEIIATALQGLNPVISLDRVLTALQKAQTARTEAQKISTAPPQIIITQQKSMLLLIDGDPQAIAIEGTHFDRIANTPFMLARDNTNQAYWLYYGSRWYNSAILQGPWRPVDKVPDQVADLVPKLQGFQAEGTPAEPTGPAIAIVVSTQPAELISFDGSPAYEPVPGGNLEAATNTDRDVFLDPTSKQYYVLLSGRWYTASNLEAAPWSFVSSTSLPSDFSKIPADSKFADVRSHIAGTTEADEAILDTKIPQTAAIKRDASIDVSYDGDPKFQAIGGTTLSYALNSPNEIIEVSPNSFFCCYQGVWYVASNPNGPWTVSVSMPPDLESVPPDCPIYNTRYVYVYEATPDYCYVGYYPGYVGCYAFDGCVVWGTGYRYEGWRGRHYFPHPFTWGFGMAYNPWTCAWGSDIHASFGGPAGFWAFGAHGVAGAWWGPMGYRPVYIHSAPPGAGILAFERDHVPEAYRGRIAGNESNVIYRHPENRGRVALTGPARQTHGPENREPHEIPGSAHPTVRPMERIFSGANGEVYRKQGDNWQQWQEHGWNNIQTTHSEGARVPANDEHLQPREPVEREPAEPRAPLARSNPNELPRESPVIHGTSAGPQIEELERENAQQERSVQRSYQFQQSRSMTFPLRSSRGSSEHASNPRQH